MTRQQVLDLIDQEIITNHNELITAVVLNPVLDAIVNQINDKVGDLQDLSTSDKSSIVNAINEVVTNYEDFLNLFTNELGAPPWDILTGGSLYDEYTYKVGGVIGDFGTSIPLSEKFYLLEETSTGDVYFASKETNIEDFYGARLYFPINNEKRYLSAPTLTQNGYIFWNIGSFVSSLNDGYTGNFQAWFAVDLIGKFLTNTGESNKVALKDDTAVEAIIFKEFDEGTTAYATTAELNTAGFTTANGYVQGFELIMRNTGTYTRYEKMSDDDNDWWYYTNANGWQMLPLI